MSAVSAACWDFQQFGHQVTFDGSNKLIIIAPGVVDVNVKRDIYSAWKEWLTLRQNAGVVPAIRTTGGDPIGGGEFTGDVYFLINGWRLQIGHSSTINGVIFSDDFPSPFIQVAKTQLVTNKVSSLVQTIAPVVENITVDIDGITVPTAAETATAVWQAVNRTLTSYPGYSGPSTAQIVAAIDADSVKLASIETKVDSVQDSVDSSGSDLTSIDLKLDVLDNKVDAIDSKVTASAVDIDATKLDVTTLIGLTEYLLKYSTNRTKIDKTAKTLTIYNDDNVTPMKVFYLRDALGDPSITDISDRWPA